MSGLLVRHRATDAHDGEDTRDRWLVSYADFITLLMAFFVVMYSVSSVNAGKFRVLSNSMVTVFNETPSRAAPIDLGGGAAPDPSARATPIEANLADDLAQPPAESPQAAGRLAALPATGTPRERLEASLAPLIERNEVTIREGRDWLELELDAELLFASGSASLDAAADPVLARVAAVVGPMGQPVRVEGNTDNVPIAGGRFGSNWQLSAARAAMVAERLAAGSVPAERLSAVGYGEFRPVADNASAAGRRANRRVVIAVARHPGVAARDRASTAAEAAPLAPAVRSLQRITELPGPAGIEP